jgi:hypothetical protein
MVPWLVKYVESSSILYENCQRMRIETENTKTHIQLKIIILDYIPLYHPGGIRISFIVLTLYI